MVTAFQHEARRQALDVAAQAAANHLRLVNEHREEAQERARFAHENERQLIGCLAIYPDEWPRVVAEGLQPDDCDLTEVRVVLGVWFRNAEHGGTVIGDLLATLDALEVAARQSEPGAPEPSWAVEKISPLFTSVPIIPDAALHAREIVKAAKYRRLTDVADRLSRALPSEVPELVATLERMRERGAGDGAPSIPSETVAPPPADAVARFPVEVLPAALRRFVEEGAAAIGCPPDYLGVPVLVLAGNAIGNSRTLRIKRTWHEGPRLSAAIVGMPGDKKTPALDLTYEPFEGRLQALKAKWHTDLEVWRARSPEERRDEPEPRLAQIATTDATLEALGDLLAANPRGILYHQDELTAWTLAMNQYKGGRGSDRKHWLSFWSGTRSPVINRRNRVRPLVIDHPFIGVVGGLQPDVLAELSAERGRQDGFVHRILFAFPDPAPLEWTDDEVAEETLRDYDAVFKGLWALQPVRDDHNVEHPEVVEFTEQSRATWVEWVNEHYGEVNAPHFPENLRGPWAKLVSYAARFALILQLCRRACGEQGVGDGVDEISVGGAGDLVDYFKSHVRRVYTYLHATPEDKQVLAAVTWIRRQPGQRTTTRLLQRAGIKGVTKSAEAYALIEQLVERGYGTSAESRVHGGPRVEFTLTWQPTVDR